MDINNLLGIIGSTALFAGGVSCLIIVLISILALVKNTPDLKTPVNLIVNAQFACFSTALLSLVILLQRDAFEYSIVFNAIEKNMSLLTKFSGAWSGQSGSLLFWSWIMSIAAIMATRISSKLPQTKYTYWVSLILCGTLFFFLVPLVFVAPPFARYWISPTGIITERLFRPSTFVKFSPTDGIGMNPSLRHPAMLIHPPTLYLGLIGFFVPYSFAITSLILNDTTKAWVNKTLPIATAAWIFLTCGMFLGSWWAYTILGWGGYWGWDAVEISGLLPWLLSFGLLHSMHAWTHSGKSRTWVYIFSIAIVILTLFGILLTRSGIIESVHAYTAGGIGPALTILIALHLFAGIHLFFTRWKSIFPLSVAQSRTQKDIVLNLFNVTLVLLVLLYLFGQTLPATSQIFTHAKNSFQPEQYKRYSAPILLALLLLTAWYPWIEIKEKHPSRVKFVFICLLILSVLFPGFQYFIKELPLLPGLGFFIGSFAVLSWLTRFALDHIPKGVTFAHHSARLGSSLIHIGFLILALGILGVENLSTQQNIFLSVGESAMLTNHTIKIQAKQEYLTADGHHIYALQAIIENRNGNSWILNPGYRYYPKIDTLTATPDVHTGFLRDTQLISTDWQRPEDGRTGLQVHIFPLMVWIWAGGIIMVCGGILHLSNQLLLHKNDSPTNQPNQSYSQHKIPPG